MVSAGSLDLPTVFPDNTFMVKSVQAGTGEVGLGKAIGLAGTKLHVWFPSATRLSVSTVPQTFEPALISPFFG